MIGQECQQADPAICASMPGTQPLLYGVLFRQLSSGRPPRHFKVRHITQFLRSADVEKDSLANLDILAKLLPFSLFTPLECQTQYFYDSQPAPASLYLAFPYYILSSDTLLLLSSDGKLALPCADPSAVRHFQFLFDEASRTAARLINPSSTAAKFLDHLLELDAKNTAFHTIEHQPCLITFLTEEEVLRYARKDLPDRDSLVQALLLRSRQLEELEDHCCIFSKAGLLDFAATGTMADLPEAYALPFTVPDRILVLKRMYAYMEKKQQSFYMANPVAFPLPPRLTCIIRANTGVEFCYFSPDLMEFKHIHIQEHSILDTFEDFFQYALQKPMVYSREETMRELSKCMEDLKNMA